MYNANEFGKRLKQLREESGLTQEQLSDLLHITIDYESKLENGKRNPSLDLCIQVSVLLSASLDYLLLGRMPATEKVKAVLRAAVQELEGLQRQLHECNPDNEGG